MWFTPCSSSSSRARSASRLGPRASAAAPKIARDDSCPVVPKGARSIIGSTLRRAPGVRIAPSHPDEEEDADFDAAIEEGEQISSQCVELLVERTRQLQEAGTARPMTPIAEPRKRGGSPAR